MKKLLTALCFIFLFSGISIAQEYNSAIGARVGAPFLASYKFFISDQGAIEAMAGFQFYNANYSALTVAGAYQHHFPIGSVEGFEWYVGGGLGVNFWLFSSNFGVNEPGVTTGLQGYGGVSYTFANIPLNLTVDVRPSVNFSGIANGFGAGGGLGVRYVINR